MEKSKIELNKLFKNTFGYEPEKYFISPGRLEIIGNHTDHNHGFALVASASLYIKCAVKKRNDGIINLNSEGNEFYGIKAQKTAPNKAEYSTTDALIKGVVGGFVARGYNVGGFDAYCVSEVPSGGGVSSSAAFELLICAILNGLYNEGKINCLELAKISQASERDYFGKPCGVLDQIGCAYGGICIVDFNDPTDPKVQNVAFPFDLKILLTNPGGSHAGLTSYYASIPNDMKKASSCLGVDYLRDSSLEELDKYALDNPEFANSRIYKRAYHYFKENERVKNAYKAIIAKDVDAFIQNINESGLSSSHLLGNTVVPSRYKNSPERALKVVRKAAPNSGHRVHGGGFMGTIISYLRPEDYQNTVKAVRAKFGPKSAIDVSISPFGAQEF